MPYPQRLIKTLVAAGAKGTANTASAVQKNNGLYKGIRITFDISVITTTDVTFTIQGVDPISGNAYDLLASAAKSSVTTFSMLIYPGAVAVANVVLNQTIPAWWKLTPSGTHATLNYSAHVEFLP